MASQPSYRLIFPKQGSPDWKRGLEMIPRLVQISDEDEVWELIDPFIDNYGGWESLSDLLLRDEAAEKEAREEIAQKILAEDMVGLKEDLETVTKGIEKQEDGYIIASSKDPRSSYARLSRLIRFCVIDDGVGFAWEVL